MEKLLYLISETSVSLHKRELHINDGIFLISKITAFVYLNAHAPQHRGPRISWNEAQYQQSMSGTCEWWWFTFKGLPLKTTTLIPKSIPDVLRWPVKQIFLPGDVMQLFPLPLLHGVAAKKETSLSVIQYPRLGSPFLGSSCFPSSISLIWPLQAAALSIIHTLVWGGLMLWHTEEQHQAPARHLAPRRTGPGCIGLGLGLGLARLSLQLSLAPIIQRSKICAHTLGENANFLFSFNYFSHFPAVTLKLCPIRDSFLLQQVEEPLFKFQKQSHQPKFFQFPGSSHNFKTDF